MKRIILYFFLTCILINHASAQFSHAGRGMYVDKFFRTAINTSGVTVVNPVFSILGVPAKEDSLLNYAKENHITYLILYDLYYVFGNSTFEGYLCSFLQKAKTQYCIEEVGVASSCSSMFDNIFNMAATEAISLTDRENSKRYSKELRKELDIVQHQYKPGDSLFYLCEATKLNMRIASFNDNCNYKLDVMVSEYEFWNATVDDCQGDLPSKDVKYTRYQAMINSMDVVRDNYNSTHVGHQLYIETYLGYLNQNTLYAHQEIANWIDGSYNGKRRVDRINTHYYGSDPSRLYSRTAAGQNNNGYYLTRFKDFCQNTTNNQTNLHPIFSSENSYWGGGVSYIGGWFSLSLNNNIFTAEKAFYNDWYDDATNFSQSTVGSATLGNVVQPGGVVWFTASQLQNHVDNPIMFTSNSPVCVAAGQNGSLQFQYQGPIEQGISFKFYITNADNLTIRCGSTTPITWPAYNPVTKTSIDLNAALNGCTLPAGDYDAHLELIYANACAAYIAPVMRVSIVNIGKIVALTPTTVCQGNPIYLQASSTSSGTITYAWYDGITAISGATTQVYAPPAASTGAHSYSCLISSSISGCSANKSNVIPVTINAAPNATITTLSTSSCSVTLQANPTGGTYLWNDGSTGPTYTTSFPGTYSVEVSKSGCKDASSNFTVSTIAGSGNVTPSVTIAANTGNTICSGSTVIFTATPSNGGAVPVFQWKKNGVNVGTNSINYSNSSLLNNDVITCVMTSNLPCASPLAATSNSVTVTVNPNVTPSVNISSNLGLTICAGASTLFTATPVNGGTSPLYQWKKNNINVGSNSNTFSDNSLLNSDVINCVMTSSAGCASSSIATSNNITMTVNAYVTPSVTISSNSGTAICSGTNVTFTATPVNGGVTPAYQWKKNNTNVGTNSATYSDNALINSNLISCVMTSNVMCVSPLTAASNSIAMTVTPVVVPAVSISANTGNTICAGTNVTFTALPVNGGITPVYQWKKNSTVIGTNSNNYSSASLANSDIISCQLTSNANCAAPLTANSNNVAMTVNPLITPVVTVSANTGTNICAGQQVIFTADVVNGGSTPSYQWKKNGTNIGSNSSTYTDNSIVNNNVISCVVTSNANCLIQPTASNSLTMTVGINVVSSVTISSNLGNTICEGTDVIFTAVPVNGGANPSYLWKKNGAIVGSNSFVYFDNSLVSNDVVICEMNSNASCAPGIAISNSITMNVSPCVQLNVKLFIQGYYRGSNRMAAVADPEHHPSVCDTITLELHESFSPYNMVYYTRGIIDINGNGQFIFSPGILNHNYYLVVHHRNALETWSLNPIAINNSLVYYDFSIDASKAYGTNEADLGDGNFGLWSGDISNGINSGVQDGVINDWDHAEIENALHLFSTGYVINDLTGDGVVESADFSLLEHNSVMSVTVVRP